VYRPRSILALTVTVFAVFLCLDPGPPPGAGPFARTAIAAPSLEVNPASVDFVLMGGTSESRTVTLTNSGDADLDFTTILGSPPPFGPHYPGPKVAVHLTDAVTTPGVAFCDPASSGGPAPDNIPCADFVTRAPLLTGRYLYIVVAEADSQGIAGAGFGIDYDGEPGSGIDILDGWNLCATGLQFPSDTWPAAGSGNLFTWDGCPHTPLPAGGVQAVAGGFYVYAYSDDVFRITEHTKLPNPSLKVIACANHQYDIDPATGVGSAVFSNNGGFGANPCTGALEGGGTPLWLTVAPTEGTIAPGADALLELTADAAGIPPGTSYSTVLKVASNDPLAPLQEVQVGLDVFGDPDIAVSNPFLDFGTLFVGASTDLSLTVSNPGPGILIVNSLAVDDPAFSVSPTGFNLGPGKEKPVTVTFHPVSPGEVTGNLTIHSNDPDEGTATVSLQGTAVTPPVIAVSPDSVGYVLFQGTTETRTVTLSNSGESDLEWVAMLTGPPAGPGIVGPKMALHAKAHAAGGQCNPVSAGGAAPDDIPCSEYVTAAPLHRATDAYIVVGNADKPGVSGVAFGIEYQGAPAAGVDIVAPFYLCATGLEFPSSTWPASGEGNVITWNTAIDCPDTEIPPNGIHAVVGAFYLYAYGEDTFRITENKLLRTPALKVNVCNAGETILDPATDAGSIVFSGNGRAGFNPCAEPPVDEGPPSWLSVDPAMGTIPPGGNALLELTADAAGVDPGTSLTARMRVDSNDPVTTATYVPVTLDVLDAPTVNAAVMLEPGTLNASSGGNWMFATVELPGGYDPADLVLETVRALGTVPADPAFTEYLDFNGNGVPDRKMRFNRAAVLAAALAALPEGDATEIVITGKIGEQAAFVARQDVAVMRPRLVSPNGGEAFAAGSWIDVTWQKPLEWEDVTTALFYWSAAAKDWVPIADGIAGNDHPWQVVDELSDACHIRLESHAAWGLAGFDESDAAFSITEQTPGIDNPSVAVLLQNIPNPFRGSTVIGFSLPGQDRVSIRVIDAAGRRVRSLLDAVMPAGPNTVTWNGRDEAGHSVASGIYFYVMETSDRRETKRMFLLR
jgi:hypothetical protein